MAQPVAVQARRPPTGLAQRKVLSAGLAGRIRRQYGEGGLEPVVVLINTGLGGLPLKGGKLVQWIDERDCGVQLGERFSRRSRTGCAPGA